MEQFEACKTTAQATDVRALTHNLEKFQGSHHLEHHVNYYYSKVESLRKQLEKAEKWWAMQIKDAHASHDDALLTLVRQVRHTETCLAELGPDPIREDQDDASSEESEIDQENEPEQKKQDRERDLDRMRLKGTLGDLQQRIEDGEENHSQELEIMITRQHNERKAFQRQISDFQSKIATTKNLFLEAKATEVPLPFSFSLSLALLLSLTHLFTHTHTHTHMHMQTHRHTPSFSLNTHTQEKQKIEGRPDPRTKQRAMSKVLARPKAIKENRELLASTSGSAHPFEDDLNDRELQERWAHKR